MALSLINVPTFQQYKADPAIRQKMNDYFRSTGWQISGDVQYADQYENAIGNLQNNIDRANQQEVLSGGAQASGFSASVIDKAYKAGFVEGTLSPDKNFFPDNNAFLTQRGGVSSSDLSNTNFSWLKSPEPFTPTAGSNQYQLGDTKETGGTITPTSVSSSTITQPNVPNWTEIAKTEGQARADQLKSTYEAGGAFLYNDVKYQKDVNTQNNLPPEITQSEEWKAASEQDKTLISLINDWQTAIKAGDVALSQDYQAAINKAVSVADPYFKQKILLAQDEVNRSIGSLTGDYQSNLKTYEDRIKQLKEDLIFNKDQLSLNQQQEMADQLRDYQTKLFGTQQQMAEAGLAFSSPRTTAESNLAAEQQGISQSTARKYQQAFREQELNQQRQTLALQQNIADLSRKKEEGLTDISRKAEEMLGTANLPATGVAPLGNITGTIDYEKQTTIPTLAETYKNWANLV